ncbi:MAG: hypothetical protein V4505_11120 [Pseudomonadota bacterium]
MGRMEAAAALVTRNRFAALAAAGLPLAAAVVAKLLDQSMRRPSLVGVLMHSLRWM